MLFRRSAAWSCILAFASYATAIDPIKAVGSKFFTSSGQQFYIKGVAYQLTEYDPLIDTTQCQLDAKLMNELGANAIRVYHVDPSGDHQGCMQAFADQGIYLFVDLDTFDTMILHDRPTWNSTQLGAFQAVLDEFQQFNNTAGVFVGNEVLTQPADAPAAPYVLAATRDIKNYRDSKKYRDIPVGYSAADIASLRPMLQDYFECHANASERLDFFSLNTYEWCGGSSFSVSGYSNLQQQAQGFPVPIFISETGCNTVPPRTFADQASILGPDMDDTWSGAIIYEWIQETNNYGLISYGPPAPSDSANTAVVQGYTRSGTPTPIMPDFTNLQNQWATLKPTGVALSAYSATASSKLPACPMSTATGWTVDPSAALPKLDGSAPAGGSVATTTASSAGSSPTASASGSAGASHKGAGVRIANPVAVVMEGDIVSTTVAALMLLGAGCFWWL